MVMEKGKYGVKTVDGHEQMVVNSWNYEETTKVKREMKMVEK